MQDDEYHIPCFRKELQDYIDGAWDAYNRVYGHLYTTEQIAFIITNDVIKLLNKIDIGWSVKGIKKYA